MTVYTKTMTESLAEMRSLQENNMDLMKKAVNGSMQTLKMKDGKLKMDKVTASAIMQIFDKVNPANQKKMEQMINDGNKSGIMKLQKFAMSKVTGFKSEEVELDEVAARGKKFDDSKIGIGTPVEIKDKSGKAHKGRVVKVNRKDDKVTISIDGGGTVIAPRSKLSIVREEIELDEAPKYELYHKDFSTAMQYAYKMAKKLHGITVKPSEIDDKVASGPKKPSEGKTNSYRLEGDKGAIQVQVYNKGGNRPYELNFYKEEVEFDENKLPDMRDALLQVRTEKPIQLDEAATSKVLAHGGKGQYKVVSGPAQDGSRETVVKFKGKVVSTGDFDRGADGWYMNIKGKKGQEFFDDAQKMADYFAKNKITEESDFNKMLGKAFKDTEDKHRYYGRKHNIPTPMRGQHPTGTTSGWNPETKTWEYDVKLNKPKKKSQPKSEEVELEEGKMKELHGYIEDGKSAEWIAKKMGVDVKTIKALMSEAYELGTNEYREYLERLTPGEFDEGWFKDLVDKKTGAKAADQGHQGNGSKKSDKPKKSPLQKVLDAIKDRFTTKEEYIIFLNNINEASARADAMRSMKSDPSMEQDPFSKDDAASDEDIKGATKNIIMQMRKAVSLRGTFPVEFGDKKKVKIPVKIAQAVQDKYNSFRKPADKEKFQARVAKSHKDMLLALKENVEVKSFRDSVLDRIDEKIEKQQELDEFARLVARPLVPYAAAAGTAAGQAIRKGAKWVGGALTGPAAKSLAKWEIGAAAADKALDSKRTGRKRTGHFGQALGSARANRMKMLKKAQAQRKKDN